MMCAELTVTGEQLRATVGTFPSGVTVVTTHEGGVDILRRERNISVLGDSAAWFSGEIVNAFPGGDHTIFTVAVSE
ncbi:MAG: hypothetical protein GX898_00835, partial [Corynebacterium sp.]|nr:hypothetical protein [Corynebacterium sp.]